jgi:hypothetical protein
MHVSGTTHLTLGRNELPHKFDVDKEGEDIYNNKLKLKFLKILFGENKCSFSTKQYEKKNRFEPATYSSEVDVLSF